MPLSRRDALKLAGIGLTGIALSNFSRGSETAKSEIEKKERAYMMREILPANAFRYWKIAQLPDTNRPQSREDAQFPYNPEPDKGQFTDLGQLTFPERQTETPPLWGRYPKGKPSLSELLLSRLIRSTTTTYEVPSSTTELATWMREHWIPALSSCGILTASILDQMASRIQQRPPLSLQNIIRIALLRSGKEWRTTSKTDDSVSEPTLAIRPDDLVQLINMILGHTFSSYHGQSIIIPFPMGNYYALPNQPQWPGPLVKQKFNINGKIFNFGEPIRKYTEHFPNLEDTFKNPPHLDRTDLQQIMELTTSARQAGGAVFFLLYVLMKVKEQFSWKYNQWRYTTHFVVGTNFDFNDGIPTIDMFDPLTGYKIPKQLLQPKNGSEFNYFKTYIPGENLPGINLRRIFPIGYTLIVSLPTGFRQRHPL